MANVALFAEQRLPLEQLVPIPRLCVLWILNLQPPRHRRRVVDSIRPLRHDALEILTAYLRKEIGPTATNVVGLNQV